MLLQIKTTWIYGPDRHNADRANNTQNYKPGTDLPKDIIYKILLELNKDTELKNVFMVKLRMQIKVSMVKSGNVFQKILLL